MQQLLSLPLPLSCAVGQMWRFTRGCIDPFPGHFIPESAEIFLRLHLESKLQEDIVVSELIP